MSDSASDQDILADLPPIPEGEFCVYGTVYAKPEQADALEAVYAETTRLAQFEPGTIYYCICRDSKDPTVFHFFERYQSQKAFEAHNSQPIIKKLLADRLFKNVTATFAQPIRPAGLPKHSELHTAQPVEGGKV